MDFLCNFGRVVRLECGAILRPYWLFFATVVLCIYISERKWPVYLKWPSIFALSYLGALIKPTVWIVLIAIVITEIISIEKFSKSILRKAFKTSVFIVAVVLLYRFCYE